MAELSAFGVTVSLKPGTHGCHLTVTSSTAVTISQPAATTVAVGDIVSIPYDYTNDAMEDYTGIAHVVLLEKDGEKYYGGWVYGRDDSSTS